jgi:hypothetical protein
LAARIDETCLESPEDAITPSRQPVALVPGANKGIGFEVARAIARLQQTVEEGAAEIVRVALQKHGPSGKFLETGGELVW